jgi:hypothetical protein
MPFVQGFLKVRRYRNPDNSLPGEEGPVDPDYGVGEGHPDNGLPPLGSGVGPDNGLPRPPPGAGWPPLTPNHPIQPAPPGTPPGSIWPPVNGPVDPGYGVGQGGAAGQLPAGAPPAAGQLPAGTPPAAGQLPSGGRPAAPDQSLPSQVFWVVCGIPGVGWRYVAIDPNAVVPSHPIHRPPPTAQPK